MPHAVELANLALAEVGQQQITTLNDANQAARLCKLHLPQAVREVLAMGIWKGARKQVVLARLSDAPTFGWAYAYQLPVDYVGMVSFNDVDTCERIQELFEVQGTTLLTDEPNVSLVYVRDLLQTGNDVNMLPPLVAKACYLNLAAKIAFPLQQSRTLKESLEQSLEIALRKAKAADFREDYKPVQNPADGSRWLRSRWAD